MSFLLPTDCHHFVLVYSSPQIQEQASNHASCDSVYLGYSRCEDAESRLQRQPKLILASVHLLDPDEYSEHRTYTPPAASCEDLLSRVPADNFLLVQATVEKNEEPLLQQLERRKALHSGRLFRGAVLYDINDPIKSSRLQEYRNAGVRCLRIHNLFQDASDTTQSLATFMQSPAMAQIRDQQFVLSLRLSLLGWSRLAHLLSREHSNIAIIAEHCGGITLPLSVEEHAAFDVFLSLLRAKAIFVKLGALHRRLKDGGNVAALSTMIQAIAEAGPRQLLWGSDWPHVDVDAKGLSESPFLAIDERQELEILRLNMSEDCFNAMLRETPASLFE